MQRRRVCLSPGDVCADWSVWGLATETTTAQVEAAFKNFTSRPDVAILLISQFVRGSQSLEVEPKVSHLPPAC
jgi:hypothetical protein